jgi:hypothetical protein
MTLPTPKTLRFSADTNLDPAPISPEMTSMRMSGRTRKPIKLFDPGTGPASKWKSDMVVNLAMTLDTGTWSDPEAEMLHALLAELDHVKISRQPIHALAAIKKVKDPDTPTVWEALSSDDSEAWMEAMSAEIKSLQARRTWNIVERSVAGRKHVIPGIWSMKKKRYPDGRF